MVVVAKGRCDGTGATVGPNNPQHSSGLIIRCQEKFGKKIQDISVSTIIVDEEENLNLESRETY